MSTVKTNTIQPVTTGDNLIIRTGAGDPERIRITTSGDVGIGCNPLTLLHVAGPEETHTQGNAAQLLVSNVANTHQIQIAVSGGGTGGYIEGWRPGIGGMPLHFQPSGSASVFSGPLYVTTELHLPRVGVDEDGPACVYFGNETTSSGVPIADGAIIKYADNFGENVDSADGLIIEKTDANQVTPDGGIAFTRRGSTGVRTYDLMIRDGRVGIGVTAPGASLDVGGGVKAVSLALTGKATSASTANTDAATTLVTKDYASKIVIIEDLSAVAPIVNTPTSIPTSRTAINISDFTIPQAKYVIVNVSVRTLGQTNFYVLMGSANTQNQGQRVYWGTAGGGGDEVSSTGQFMIPIHHESSTVRKIYYNASASNAAGGWGIIVDALGYVI